MDFSFKITTHGRALLAACMARSAPLELTRVSFGDGRVDEDTNLADVHELVHFVTEGSIGERTHENDRLYMDVQYANDASHAEAGAFILSEFLVCARHPETGQETDFLYATLGDYTQPVPAYHAGFEVSTWTFPLTTVISDQVNVTISAPGGLVTYNKLLSILGSRTIRQEIEIPAERWRPDPGSGGVAADIPGDDIRESQIPLLTVLPESLAAAAACGFGDAVQTLPGLLRVYARTAPQTLLRASLVLLGTSADLSGAVTGVLPATETQLGGVMVRKGSGLTVDPEGCLALDSASKVEIADVFKDSNGQN